MAIPKNFNFLMTAAVFLALSLSARAGADSLSIQSAVNGSTATLTVRDDFGGSVTSFTYRGVNYINASDHGRGLQSADHFDHHGECFNPTEAGNRNNMSSQLLSWSNGGGVLSTMTDMAFWMEPGGNGGGGDCNGGAAINTTLLSGHIFQKTVSFGLGGFQNVLNYQLTFNVPEQHEYGIFEALTGYMPVAFGNTTSSFSKFFSFSPQTSTLSSLPVVAAYYQGEPVMFSTVDGQHAMAVYAPSGSPNGGYGVHMFGSVSKWNCVYVEPGPVVYGPYSYNCNVIFGTVNEVLNTLRGLTVGLSNTLVPVFRFLRTNKMDHFLTTDFSGTANHFIPGWQGQKKSLYNFEQTAFGVYDTAIDEGMIPLYLCYQVAAIDHFVSLYSDCEGQAYEGVLGYVSSTPRTGYVPIYRFYRTSVADHLTTTDYSEGPPNGYTFEYILGYAPTYN